MLVGELFYIADMIFVKISLGIFFLRIAVDKWQRNTIYVCIASACIVGFAYFIFAIFQCGVPNAGYITLWEKRVVGLCTPKARVLAAGYAHGVVNTMTDVALVALTIPMVRAVKIRNREKTIIFCILSLAAW
jgi:hypothetical protein